MRCLLKILSKNTTFYVSTLNVTNVHEKRVKISQEAVIAVLIPSESNII